MTKPKAKADPNAGQLQIVATWRTPAPLVTVTEYRNTLEHRLRRWLLNPTALYVTAYEIGAGGEASTDEGRWDTPNTDGVGP